MSVRDGPNKRPSKEKEVLALGLESSKRSTLGCYVVFIVTNLFILYAYVKYITHVELDLDTPCVQTSLVIATIIEIDKK